MYAEEYLPEDAIIEEMSIGDITISDSLTVDSVQLKNRKMVELHKLSDPDYYKWYAVCETVEKGENDQDTIVKKIERVDAYSTPVLANALIRNASTGIKSENDRAGSLAEDLYFVVADTTGACRLKMNARGRNMFNTDQEYMRYLRQMHDTKKLYYRNPEEFERHQHIQVPQQIKEAWYEKNLAARQRM